MRLIDAEKMLANGIKDKTFRVSRCQDIEHDQDVYNLVFEDAQYFIDSQPTIDAVEVVRCRDCKYFELDRFEKVNGLPIIVAHSVCMKWGNGCGTDENGFCFMGEKVTE